MKGLLLFLTISLCVLNVNAAYQRVLARQLAYYSIVAYESPNIINAWNCANCRVYGISQPKAFLDATQTVQGYTGYASNLNAVIVSFRGSNNIPNWLADLATAPIPYTYCGGCLVHSGFLASYGLVVSTVRNTVNNLLAKYRGARLIITGHSLGGAIAILAGADLSMYHTVSAIYTFGQPRVGNPAFSNWFEPKLPNTFRLVHYADIVPHVPPSALGYQHSAFQAWYTSNMQTYKLCGRQASDCANSLGSYSLGDHDMNNYIKLPSLAQQQTSLLTKVQSFFSNFIVKVGLRQQSNHQWKIIEKEQTKKLYQKLKKLIKHQFKIMNDFIFIINFDNIFFLFQQMINQNQNDTRILSKQKISRQQVINNSGRVEINILFTTDKIRMDNFQHNSLLISSQINYDFQKEILNPIQIQFYIQATINFKIF